MNNSQPFKRKKLFIQPAFQRKFILWGMAAIVFASVLSAALLYFLLTAVYESQNQSAHIILVESWHRLGVAILLANFVALLVGLVIVAAVVLYRSHKIAGPLYRFCRTFEKVGQGDFSEPLQLRKNDELNEVAEAIENMIQQLNQQRSRQQQLLQSALDIIEKTETQDLDNNQTQASLASVKQLLNQLQEQ